jgi:urease accessory protein
MLQISKLLAQGRGLAPVLLKRAASVELDWDVRQKSRFDATDSQGRALGVFLPRGSVVRGDDVLVAEDGSLIRVIAAKQPVLLVTISEHGNPFDLTRAAYHLGNRHVPIELRPGHIKIELDHVLADMLRAMHLKVEDVSATFEPEGGAYSSHDAHSAHAGHHHGHEHAQEPAKAHVHDETCGHDHGHEHAPAKAHVHDEHCGHGHEHAPAKPHVHDESCGHGHDHGSHKH